MMEIKSFSISLVEVEESRVEGKLYIFLVFFFFGKKAFYDRILVLLLVDG
jgi:hypothetical protein